MHSYRFACILLACLRRLYQVAIVMGGIEVWGGLGCKYPHKPQPPPPPPPGGFQTHTQPHNTHTPQSKKGIWHDQPTRAI